MQAVARDRDLVYEPVGGINPVGGPVALCPGGTNRITGQLAEGFWGASCDADEREEGALFSKAVLPGAVLAKSHVPDLAQVMPPFNVESIERRPDELVLQRASRRKVEFESLDFNRRFLATVPQRVRPGRPAGDLQPGVPGLGDDDRQRDRLRRLRAAALVPVAAAGPQPRPARGRARQRRRRCSSGCARRWRSQASTPIRRAPGTPAWSLPGARAPAARAIARVSIRARRAGPRGAPHPRRLRAARSARPAAAGGGQHLLGAASRAAATPGA